MKAAWYERLGNPQEVLNLGEVEITIPGAGEVRVLCVCIRCQSIGCQAAEWLGWAKNATSTGNSPQ